ncbi:MAG: hypothetical protein K0R03_313 [Moraxellaceae bacterium]|nr:hypothetical protein [Moraxellaceae bacterium]MDF3029755.1 hypothetical protein [Moraxellaceae bacterium]
MLASLATELSSLRLPLRIEMTESETLELSPEPRVTLRILDPGLLAQQPSLDQLAEAYVEKRIELDGPIMDVIGIVDHLSRVLGEKAPLPPAVRDGRSGVPDVAAIAAHGELATDFYRLWLDPEMVWSCAYFETGRESLATAQIAKLRHICRKLRLQPGEHLLDFGCGWGALSRLAAREFDVKVLGIATNPQQLEQGRARVKAEGLQERVRLEMLDYRKLPRDGRFDKIASIGMSEHVGHANLALYFRRLHDAVRPGGLVLDHGVTARHGDARLPQGKGGAAFIDRYVFPQGEIPHLGLAIARMCDAGLEIADVENLRPHYARTLECWSAALEKHLSQARRLLPEKALRLWRLYLAGCAYAFRHGWVQVHQVLALRPQEDGGQELPWSRRDLYS